jgi:hypothetical protein
MNDEVWSNLWSVIAPPLYSERLSTVDDILAMFVGIVLAFFTVDDMLAMFVGIVLGLSVHHTLSL